MDEDIEVIRDPERIREAREKAFVHMLYDVLADIWNICEDAVPNETAGYLLGKVYFRDEDRKRKFIFIDNYLQLPGVESRYTVFVNREQLAQLAKMLPKNEVIVGWYHSHPGYGLFLSLDDINTQLNIFYEDFHVAMVVDPVNGEYAFFKVDPSDRTYYRVPFAIWVRKGRVETSEAFDY